MERRLMKIFDATDARNHFGEMIDTAQREPVEIRKKGRSFVVIVAYQDYQNQQEELQKAQDYLLAKAAEEAEGEGFIGATETEKFLERIRSA